MSASVWLGESYQALKDQNKSQEWFNEACCYSDESRKFDLVSATYWRDRALVGLNKN